jgi:hypothetical protein
VNNLDQFARSVQDQLFGHILPFWTGPALDYGSSDTRTHVATSTVERLLDHVQNTPEDGLRSSVCVRQRCELIGRNQRCRGGSRGSRKP